MIANVTDSRVPQQGAQALVVNGDVAARDVRVENEDVCTSVAVVQIDCRRLCRQRLCERTNPPIKVASAPVA